MNGEKENLIVYDGDSRASRIPLGLLAIAILTFVFWTDAGDTVQKVCIALLCSGTIVYCILVPPDTATFDGSEVRQRGLRKTRAIPIERVSELEIDKDLNETYLCISDESSRIVIPLSDETGELRRAIGLALSGRSLLTTTDRRVREALYLS